MRLVLLLASALILLLLAGCGGGSDSTTPTDSDFQFEAAPENTAGDPDHWAEVWCQIDGSMTRDEAIELMGEPSEEFDASEGQPQSQWDAGSFHYTLFYDNNGHAEQAYVNHLELSTADKPFPCALVRFF